MLPFKLKSRRVIRGLQRAALIMAVKMADEGRRQQFDEMHNYDMQKHAIWFLFYFSESSKERESMKTRKILLACMQAHASPYHQPAL